MTTNMTGKRPGAMLTAGAAVALVLFCLPLNSANAQQNGNAGAVTAGQAMKDNIEKRDDQLSKLDAEREAAQRNRAKAELAKPETGGHIDTGGTTGFINPPPKEEPKQDGPSFAESCWNGICTVVKIVAPLPALVVQGISNALTDSPEDEAKAQKEHNDAAHKAAEERKLEQQKSTAAPKLEAPKPEVKSETRTTGFKTSEPGKAVPAKIAPVRTANAFKAEAARVELSHVEATRVEAAHVAPLKAFAAVQSKPAPLAAPVHALPTMTLSSTAHFSIVSSVKR